MEPKSKVYINPNFRRTPQIYTSLLEDSKTTYFNKNFPEGLPKNQIYQKQDDANSRKIYVNPNFRAVYNSQGVLPNTSDDYINKYNTMHLNQKASNSHYFVKNIGNTHSFNYDMLQNKNVYSDTRFLENSKTNFFNKSIHTDLRVVQPINNSLQIPLSKSRYCIVRRKNEISQTTVKVNLNNNNMQLIPQSNVSVLPFTSISTLDQNTVSSQKMKLYNTTPTKIKISKYKTVPISYLKSNSKNSVTNKIKPSVSATQPYNKIQGKNGRLNSSLLATYSKNRFKFVKSKISVSSTIDIKPVLKICPLKLKRNISVNKSKVNVKGKFKINNIPCRLFSKYGKCLRKDYGKCEYLHDKKHVSLCRKFLKGICHDEHCTLSHELTAKKMPTCYFYLKGMCTKEHCPYLHIKLSETTKICQDFIKGYCEKGDVCPFRHVKKQEIKNAKSCKLNTSSKRQQKRIIKNKNGQIKLNHKKVYKNDKNKTELQEKSDSDCRYYDDAVNNDDEVSCEIIKPTRCKLGTLPSFIQL